MWHQWSHRPARQEPSNPPAAPTLSSGARWRFSCPPMERHHRGLLHFVLPIIKQCIKTSNQTHAHCILTFGDESCGSALWTPTLKIYIFGFAIINRNKRSGCALLLFWKLNSGKLSCERVTAGWYFMPHSLLLTNMPEHGCTQPEQKTSVVLLRLASLSNHSVLTFEYLSSY